VALVAPLCCQSLSRLHRTSSSSGYKNARSPF